MSYGIIFWGNSSHSIIICRKKEKKRKERRRRRRKGKKKAIRIMEGCRNRVLCRNLFKKLQILPLTSQYMLSLLMLVVQNNFF